MCSSSNETWSDFPSRKSSDGFGKNGFLLSVRPRPQPPLKVRDVSFTMAENSLYFSGKAAGVG
jgi:hypothetical protein